MIFGDINAGVPKNVFSFLYFEVLFGLIYLAVIRVVKAGCSYRGGTIVRMVKSLSREKMHLNPIH